MSPQNSALFHRVDEKDVTRSLVREFMAEFDEYVESDVIVVGAGPSGLICARDLAREGVKVLVIERNNYLGGGFWIGGFLMNKVVVRSPAEQHLAEMGIPFKETVPGLFVADGPHACSKLIANACDSGAKFLNMATVDDVVLREGNRVAGVVINWTPVGRLPREITCVDPVGIEAKVVVDATGHDASVVKLLASRGMAKVPGCAPMWVERSEDAVVAHTGQVHPGVIAAGMAVSSVYALPRMGPSFGGMLLSGAKAAAIALALLQGKKQPVRATVPAA